MARICFLICICISCVSGVVSAQTPKVSENMAELRKLVDDGKSLQALRSLRAVAASNPAGDSIALVYVLLGQLFLEQGLQDSAQASYTKALKWIAAQPRPDKLLQAESWAGLAACTALSGRFAQALDDQSRALKIVEGTLGRDSKAAAKAGRQLGDIYLALGDSAAAKKYITRALEIQQRLLAPDDPELAASFLSSGNVLLFSGAVESSLIRFEEALALRTAKFGARHPSTAAVHQRMGWALFYKQEYEQALKKFKLAADILEGYYKTPTAVWAQAQAAVGTALLAQFDIREAESVFRTSIKLLPESFLPDRASVQFKLGKCLEWRGLEVAALIYYDSARVSLEKGILTEGALQSELLERIGAVLARQGNYARALPFLQRSAQGYLTLSGKYSQVDLIRVLNQQAACFIRLSQRKNALQVLQQIESKLQALPAGSLELQAAFLKHKALAYAAIGRYESALGFVRSAVGLLWPDRNISNVHRVLGPDIIDLLVLESAYMVKAGTKAVDALGLLETALQLAERLHLPFVEYEQQVWNDAIHGLFSAAISTYFLAWNTSKKQVYLDKALLLSERYKDHALLQAALSTHPARFHDVSTQLLEAKKEREAVLYRLEKQWWRAVQQEQVEVEASLTSAIATSRQALKEVNQDIAKESVVFSRLMGYSKDPGVRDLQQLLAPEQSMIEFYLSDSEIFAFILTRTSLKAVRLKKDFPLEILASNYLSRMQVLPKYAGIEREKQALLWAGTAHQLYQRLLAPILPVFQETPRIIIVPDGVLRYIPFEALLLDAPAYPTQFKSHAYLGSRYSISYAPSANVLHAIVSRKARGQFSGKYLLTMAPDFSGNSFGLANLPNNVEESTEVRRLFGGRQLKGREASLDNFMGMAPEYRVVHVPTHARSADSERDTSYIAFAERRDNQHNALLYAAALYNVSLESDLVVLSRLELPLGLSNSENGLLGFIGGLFYAGTKSLSGTFWKADNRHSAKLVERYFFYLRGGLAKDLALQRAKQDFLNEHPNIEAHPYYWAGLTIAGDTAALPDPRLQWVVSWLLALVGLGIALTLYWRWIEKRRPKQQV